jgi:holo-[acyl-carrier protein] synthase
MQLKTGVDLVEIARIKGLKAEIRKRFIERVFTPSEIAELGDSDQRLSACFAAKEAVSKALGCGIGPIGWQEIVLHHLPNGEPTILLFGKAAELAAHSGLTQWSISISHSKTHAIAMVVALGESD